MEQNMLRYLIYSALSIAFIVLIEELIQPVDRRWTSSGSYKLPSGPRGHPLVGNMLQVRRSRQQGNLLSLFKSLKSHGEMTTLHMGSRLWVLLNTNRVTDEIIDKRARLTAERPPMPIAGDLVSRGMRSLAQPTHIWAENRRMMRAAMNSNYTKMFTESSDVESTQLLLSYLKDPTMWHSHNSRYAIGTMHGVIAGVRMEKSEEEMQDYRRLTREWLNSYQSTAVELYPWVARLPKPLQFWRAKWVEVGTRHNAVFKSWWDTITPKALSEKAGPSWVRDVLMSQDSQFKGTQEEALYVTNTVISAGGDNPKIALNTFIMACLRHPKEYRKCREEVDKVCGGEAQRLPGLEDISAMPFVCAFLKESMRWRPIVPLIPPHMASEDFIFEDYHFPKGTTFVINMPAVCTDYDDPDVFNPERWIDGRGNEAKLTHNFWGFGGGQRVCVGIQAVQQCLFIPLARLLYCFDFEARGIFDDTKIKPYDEGEPFPARMKLRSAAHERLIYAEAMARGL